MFWLLFGLISCEYVPFSITNSIILEIQGDNDFQKLIKKKHYVVCLFLPENHDDSENCHFIFSKLGTVFSNDVTFTTVTYESAPKAFKQYDIHIAAVCFFYEGEFGYAIPFPNNELELIAAIQFYLRPQAPPVKNTKQLYDMLGDTAYSVLATRAKMTQAHRILYDFSHYFGVLNIVTVTPELMKEIGFAGEQLCLYRKSDKIITPINDDMSSFIQKTKPTFIPKVNEDTIRGTGGEFFLLVVQKAASPEQKEILSKLGEQYPECLFGIVDSTELSVLQELTTNQIKQFPSFLAINYYDDYYYPIQSSFGNKSEDYVKKIISKQISPHYRSEPIPTVQDDQWITKVVGTNYAPFVSDPKHDIVMFYLHKDEKGKRLAHKVGKYLTKQGITSVKVGFIDPYNNSSPIRFPVLSRESHIQVFPASNKTSNSSFYGSTTLYSVLDFVKQKASTSFPINESLFNSELEMQYLIECVNDLQEYTDDDLENILEYLKRMGQKLGLGQSTDSVIQALYQAQGGFESGFEEDYPHDFEFEEEKEEQKPKSSRKSRHSRRRRN